MRSHILIRQRCFYWAAAPSLLAQQVSKEPVEGIRNLARLETTVACAGASRQSSARDQEMGFVSSSPPVASDLALSREGGRRREGRGLAVFSRAVRWHSRSCRCGAVSEGHHVARRRAGFFTAAAATAPRQCADQAAAVIDGSGRAVAEATALGQTSLRAEVRDRLRADASLVRRARSRRG